MEIKEKVLMLLQKKYDIPDKENIDQFNYVESGFINSLEIVQFLYNLEEAFDIEFTEEEMTSDMIKTVGGLIDIIKSKK